MPESRLRLDQILLKEHLIRRALNFILPVSCRLCGQHCETSTPICSACNQDLPRISHACSCCGIPLTNTRSTIHPDTNTDTTIYKQNTICGNCQYDPPLFASITAPFLYQSPVKQLISEFKYKNKLVNTRLLSDLLLDHIIKKQIPRPQALLPVPLHKQRIKERGFNQALEIAKPLAKYWNIPVLPDAVVRHKHTKPQTGLSAKLRQNNLRGAFEIKTIHPYDNVAIIDDVVTTGATTRELAKALSSAGISKIDVIALARAGKG